MKRAIISDIHGNLAAFEAVLKDIQSEKVDDIVCLGDVIGYGPDPRACLELAFPFAVNLLGNHEEAVMENAIGFNPKAKAAIEWTKDQLSLPSEPVEKNRELWNFIGSLPRSSLQGEVLFVHGSPRDPTREYIFNGDWQDRKKMDDIFAAPLDVAWKVCFTGHTHCPGVFVQDQPYRYYDPRSISNELSIADLPRRGIVNVGSVGQPRDGDRRSSYVVLEDNRVRFKRLEYDVQRTVDRFRQCPGLPEYLARRLEEGK